MRFCLLCNGQFEPRGEFAERTAWYCPACLDRYPNQLPRVPNIPPPPPPPPPVARRHFTFARQGGIADTYGYELPVNNPGQRLFEKRDWCTADAGNLARIAQSLERIEKALDVLDVFVKVAKLIEKICKLYQPRKRRRGWERQEHS